MVTDRLGDIRLFVEASALGSLSAAGRKLGFSSAASSVRLAKLEASLKVKLFDRTTRSLRLTDEGRRYLHHCLLALEHLAKADAAVQVGTQEVSGKIRISASTDFGRNMLNEWIMEFSKEHPNLQVALFLNDSISKLTEDDIDIAIRFGKPEDGEMVARHLAPNWRVLCASPSYLKQYGEPKTPDDLLGHKFIILINSSGPLNDYQFSFKGQRWTQRIPLEMAWEVNDGSLASRWAIDGCGITRKTIWDAAEHLHSGRLEVVLPQFTIEEAGVYAILHRNRYQLPRINLFLEFLQKKFRICHHEILGKLPGSPAGSNFEFAS